LEERVSEEDLHAMLVRIDADKVCFVKETLVFKKKFEQDGRISFDELVAVARDSTYRSGGEFSNALVKMRRDMMKLKTKEESIPLEVCAC
jgi:hypothetical protein